MAARANIVTVTTTPTPLLTGADADSNAQYREAVIKNTGAVTVYVGGSDVTTAAGFPLAASEGLALSQVMPDSVPYGIVATGTCTVAVLQLGV